MKLCLRCGQDSAVSVIGAALRNFVCDVCRKDHLGWEFNGTRVSDMEYQNPLDEQVHEAWEGVRNANQYC